MFFNNSTQLQLEFYNSTYVGLELLSGGGVEDGGPSPRWALVSLIVVPLWILFGNLLVLLAVYWNKHLRTLSNCVIASLALTDLMLAVLVVPLGTYHVVNGRWDLGLVPCLIWTGSDVMLSTASILHLGAIAIHRYLGISYPLHFRNNADNHHIVALLVPVWCVSVLISLPLIIRGLYHQEHVLIDMEELGPQCGIFDHVFVIYSSTVSFFVPLAIMVFADVRSVQILRNTSKVALQSNHGQSRRYLGKQTFKRSASIRSNEVTMNETTTSCSRSSTVLSPMIDQHVALPSNQDPLSCRSSPTTTITTPGSDTEPTLRLVQDPFRLRRSTTTSTLNYFGMFSARGMVKINSRERRAEKTLIWVFVCFVALWLPFFCTNMAYGVCMNCEIPPDLFMSFAWLGYLSSGVNPCIYTFLNKDFRVAFKQILCCKPCSRRPRGQIT